MSVVTARCSTHLGARAYTKGNDIAFAGTTDLHTAAHEAAHVVQQRSGLQLAHAVGQAGDAHERHADAVADAVVRGESAESLLSSYHADGGSGGSVQRQSAATVQAQNSGAALDFDALADRIHEAMGGLGTDEEAVYSALFALAHDQTNIDELKRVYQARFGISLIDAIRDDFSGSELSYALSLLQAQATGTTIDYDHLAEQIHDAVSGLGTDEEAAYTALSQLNGDPAKITELADIYLQKYGVALMHDIQGDFSGSELDHALELQGISPWVQSMIEFMGDQDSDVIRRIVDENVHIVLFDTAYDTWRYNDGRPDERVELTGLRGNTDESTRTIRIRAGLSLENAAVTLFHEMNHWGRPAVSTRAEYLDEEVDVRIESERFALRHGLPETRPGYRNPDGTINEQAIRDSIYNSSHYNPQNRVRILREYEGEQATSGWHVP